MRVNWVFVRYFHEQIFPAFLQSRCMNREFPTVFFPLEFAFFPRKIFARRLALSVLVFTGKIQFKALQGFIKRHSIKMEDTTEYPSVDSFFNTSVEKSSDLLASETVDSPADNLPPAPYRLFNRQKTIHEVFGGGMVADVMLWRKGGICIGVLVAATVAWYLFERTRYTFLSLISTILLLLVAILFIWANVASLLQRPLPPLPELELSEETINKVAASMRVRINAVLAVAHDIALGKDIKLFAKAIIFLWLFSILGGWCNFFTLAYIGILVSLTIPALYNKYEDHVDRNAEIAHKQIVKHYRNFDANVLSKISRGFSEEKKMQ